MGRQPLQLTAFVVQVYSILIALAVGLGVAILAGGAERFASPGLNGPRNLLGWLPGPAYAAWGIAFLIYGMALIVGLSRTRGTASAIVWVGVAIYLFWAFGLLGSVLNDPQVAGTGVVAYSAAAALHAATGHRFRFGPAA